MWGGEGCKECLGGEVKRRDCQIPASRMAEQVVADVFMRPSEGRNSMLLKLKKGLSALCHISQAGINTL